MNQLKSLDISNNKKLKELFCANNNFSPEALNKIYKDLPLLSVRPQNANLYVGGNNQFAGAKSYLAELKNWYPTDRGNGGGGRPAAFFSNIGGNNIKPDYEVRIEVEALSPSAALFYDNGTGVDEAIELKEGKAQLSVHSNGNLVVIGNVKTLKVEGLEMYKADLSTMSTLQSLNLSKSNVKDLDLADQSALKQLVVSDCPEMTYLILKSQPQLQYLDVRNCALTASTLNNIFESLPKLKDRPATANLLIQGNQDDGAANYEVAYRKNWNFDIPASVTEAVNAERLTCVVSDGFILVNSKENAYLSVYTADGVLIFAGQAQAMTDVFINVANEGVYIVNVLMENGEKLSKKLFYKL